MKRKHKHIIKKKRSTNQIKKYKNKPSLGLFGAIHKGIKTGTKERYEKYKEEKEERMKDKHGIPIGKTERKHTRWYWR